MLRALAATAVIWIVALWVLALIASIAFDSEKPWPVGAWRWPLGQIPEKVYTPTFRPGQCLISRESEAWETGAVVTRVEGIGEQKYRVSVWADGIWLLLDHGQWFSSDRFYRTVPCPAPIIGTWRCTYTPIERRCVLVGAK